MIQPHVRRSVELTSLYDDLARAGEAPTTEVLSLERVPASAEIAEELDLGEGAEVVVLRRLRRSHGEPLALMTNHLPGRFHPTVEELAERGLYQFLRSQGVRLPAGLDKQKHPEQGTVRDGAPCGSGIGAKYDFGKPQHPANDRKANGTRLGNLSLL